MNKTKKHELRVLAIDPFTRGFGFVIFEGPERLIDWGIAHVRENKHRECLKRIEELVDHYSPNIIVLEDTAADGSRRCDRVRELLGDIPQLAGRHKIPTRRVSPSDVQEAFSSSDASTKEQMAGALAAWYPELLPYLPPHRKCWMSEDVRISMFDAAALASAFFHFDSKRPRSRETSPSSAKS